LQQPENFGQCYLRKHSLNVGTRIFSVFIGPRMRYKLTADGRQFSPEISARDTLAPDRKRPAERMRSAMRQFVALDSPAARDSVVRRMFGHGSVGGAGRMNLKNSVFAPLK